MTSRLTIALSSLVAVGAAATWHEARDTRKQVLTLATLNERRMATDAAIQRAEERLATLAAEQTRLQANLPHATSNPTRTPRSADATDTQPSARSFKNPFTIIHEDPQLQARWFASRRAAIATTYGPFFHLLGRNTADLSKFTDLAIQREETDLDLSATMWQQQLPKTDSALVAAEARARATYETGVTELLGAGDAQRLREYELTLPVRKIVTALAGVAAMAGEPLAVDQAEQLTQLLAASSGRYLRTGATDVQTIDWSAIDERARGILTPAQLALFQTVEPEDGFNLYTFRFGSRVARLTNQAKRAAAGLPEVSIPQDKVPAK